MNFVLDDILDNEKLKLMCQQTKFNSFAPDAFIA